jgi:hypothetical protein
MHRNGDDKMQPLKGFAPGCGYITPGERAAARRLVRAITVRSLAIQVWDGGEYALSHPSSEDALVLRHLGATGEDTLQVYRDGKKVGWFHLVWGNADDGSEIVCDHTAGEECESIFNEAFPA